MGRLRLPSVVRLAVVVACAIAAMTAVTAGTATSRMTRTGGGNEFKVTSSLDGRSTLPNRIHWLAHPKLSTAQVAKVDFLIDGQVRWTERKAPYEFAQDNGYLITTWLKPGIHRFAARVTDTGGHRVSDTVSARIPPAQAPPKALAHHWKRTLTAADQKKVEFDNPPPKGSWEIVFDQVGIWELDPLGGGTITQYAPHPGVLDVYAPIQMAPDGVGVAKYGHTKIGGYECDPDGPFGSYTWSITGSKLTLTAKKEPCAGRRAILEGVWVRTS
jgi:hypothetical protein